MLNIKIFKTSSSYIFAYNSHTSLLVLRLLTSLPIDARKLYQSKRSTKSVNGENIFILKTNSVTLNIGHKRTR